MKTVRLVACRSCGTTIFFGAMRSMRTMPLDAAPDPNGAWMIHSFTTEGVPYMVKVEPDFTGDRFTSHFASCANAAAHRVTSARRAPTTVPAK